ncbi:hypothetical protein B0H13DRAFT_1969380 [Mycena leptocephala]|nr:hypothetical protein B0H13DRAFT_1969380 [Mycena leptocephala]
MIRDELVCEHEARRLQTHRSYFIRGAKREILGHVYQLLGNVNVRSHVRGGAGDATSRDAFHRDFLASRPLSEITKFFLAYLPPLHIVPTVFTEKRIKEALGPITFTLGNKSIHDLTVAMVFEFLQTLRASEDPGEAASTAIWEAFAVALLGRPVGAEWRTDTRVFKKLISSREPEETAAPEAKLAVASILRDAKKFEARRKDASNLDHEKALRALEYMCVDGLANFKLALVALAVVFLLYAIYLQQQIREIQNSLNRRELA